jgi:hypothetical protein
MKSILSGKTAHRSAVKPYGVWSVKMRRGDLTPGREDEERTKRKGIG